MARLQFLVIFALLGRLLSSNALPVRNNVSVPSSSHIPSVSSTCCQVAEVVHLGRDVPEILNLEARAPPGAAAKRPAVQKAPAKAAPRKKAVGKKTTVPKKVAAPKKAVPASKRKTKQTAKKAGKGPKKGADPDFCELPVKGTKGGKAVKGVKLVKRGCVRTSLFSLPMFCALIHL